MKWVGFKIDAEVTFLTWAHFSDHSQRVQGAYCRKGRHHCGLAATDLLWTCSPRWKASEGIRWARIFPCFAFVHKHQKHLQTWMENAFIWCNVHRRLQTLRLRAQQTTLDRVLVLVRSTWATCPTSRTWWWAASQSQSAETLSAHHTPLPL